MVSWLHFCRYCQTHLLQACTLYLSSSLNFLAHSSYCFTCLEMANGGRPLLPGSDVDEQLKRIFKLVGTPNESTWPNITKLPEYKVSSRVCVSMGKRHTHTHTHARTHAHTHTHTQEFPPYPSTPLELVVPTLNSSGIQLLAQHLVCFPTGRISAEEAMRHEYFADLDPAIKA